MTNLVAMAPLGIDSLSVLGIAQRNPSTRADGKPEHGERRVAHAASGSERGRRPPLGVSVEPAMTTRMASTPTAAARHVLNSQRNRPLWRVSAWSLT